MAELHDEPRSGAPRTIRSRDREDVEELPWERHSLSSRDMAKSSGLSVSTVQRIWRTFGLQPHRMETFKLSTDPTFVAKCA